MISHDNNQPANIMPFLASIKLQDLQLSSAENYRWRFMG